MTTMSSGFEATWDLAMDFEVTESEVKSFVRFVLILFGTPLLVRERFLRSECLILDFGVYSLVLCLTKSWHIDTDVLSYRFLSVYRVYLASLDM